MTEGPRTRNTRAESVTWREGLAAVAPAVAPMRSWGQKSEQIGESELIMVPCQILTVVGGLATHKHVPVA